MSTTRHRRRSWQQAGTRAILGIFIGADAIWTMHTTNGLLHIATVALGVTVGALVLGIGSWATSIGWHRGRQRYLVHAVAFTPLRRPLYPIGTEHQDTPAAEVALHYTTTAENWRHDGPGDDEDTDPRPMIAGPRPYASPLPAEVAAAAGAAQ